MGSVGTTREARANGAIRRRRADAERNLELLVAAAKEIFVEVGVDAPGKLITDRAGVGVGTLYRHYPRRSDLIVAVLHDEIHACVEAAQALSQELAPAEAVMAWIGPFGNLVRTKQGLAAALHSGDRAYTGLPDQLLDLLEPALSGLLVRAADAGAIRPGIAGREIMVAVALMSQPVPGLGEGFEERAIGWLLEGLMSGD